jgi:inner membrane protein
MGESALKSSMLLRMLIVFFLTLLLLIPIVRMESLIEERAQRRDAAIHEVSEKWASDQTFTGPVLTVPLKRVVRTTDGKQTVDIQRLNILPDSLALEAELNTEVRYRGIYEAVLYKMRLKGHGTFDFACLKNEDWKDSTPMWDDAYLTVGITDLRGIKENILMSWNSANLPAQSGVRSEDVVQSGITFDPHLGGTGSSASFDVEMALNGSSDVAFVPVGRITQVKVVSSWPNPSFNGMFLPDRRDIQAKGFSAEWRVLELNRNFPQAFIGGRYRTDSTRFGVTLIEPVDHYQRTLRSSKYAVMIVVLTFLALFLAEVLGKELLHPAHYAMLGFALILFYLLLLSLSEHLGFDIAYLFSSVAILLMIVLYSFAILQRKRVALMLGALVFSLYGFLYVLLRLEDFALVAGSAALFLILAATMYLTRKVNWFSMKNG